MNEEKLWLIYIWGDVEPDLHGPFATDEERLAKAKELCAEEGEPHGGVYRLSCEGTPGIASFTGQELEE